MAYLKPAAFTRHVVNPVIGRLKLGHVEELTVAGRRSGVADHVPVVPVQVGARRYLVAPYGVSDWVKNLRVAGEGELQGHDRPTRFRAREVPIEQRGPVLDAYRQVGGRTVEGVSGRCPTRQTTRSSRSSHCTDRRDRTAETRAAKPISGGMTLHTSQSTCSDLCHCSRHHHLCSAANLGA